MLPGNVVKRFGDEHGISDASFSMALSRLQNWVVLAMEVVSAEWPQWDIMNSFCIFNLSRWGDDLEASDANSDDSHFARLGQAFKVDGVALKAQFLDYLPSALSAAKANSRASNLDAWVVALGVRFTSKASRHAHPRDALHSVLVHFACWLGCTTSGVEQMFSKIKSWLLTPRRRSLSRSTEDDEIVLACGELGKYDKNKMMLDAQKIWCKFYGRVRPKRRLFRFRAKRKQAPTSLETVD
jgi:hypothetical protein